MAELLPSLDTIKESTRRHLFYAAERQKAAEHCNKFGDYGHVEECLENHRNYILKKYRHIYSK
jgi:hypothetical protein